MPYMFANLCVIGINLLQIGYILCPVVSKLLLIVFCNNINCQVIEGMSNVKYYVILSAKLSNFS